MNNQFSRNSSKKNSQFPQIYDSSKKTNRFSQDYNHLDFDNPENRALLNQTRHERLKQNASLKEKSYNYKTEYDEEYPDTPMNAQEIPLQTMTEVYEKEKSKISTLSMTKYNQLAEYMPRSSLQYLPDLGPHFRKQKAFLSQRKIGECNKKIVSKIMLNEEEGEDDEEEQGGNTSFHVQKRVNNMKQEKVFGGGRNLTQQSLNSNSALRTRTMLSTSNLFGSPAKNTSSYSLCLNNNKSSSRFLSKSVKNLEKNHNHVSSQSISLLSSQKPQHTSSQQHSYLLSGFQTRSGAGGDYNRTDMLGFQLQHNKDQVSQINWKEQQKLASQMRYFSEKASKEKKQMAKMKAVKKYPTVKTLDQQATKEEQDIRFSDYLRQFQSQKKQELKKNKRWSMHQLLLLQNSKSQSSMIQLSEEDMKVMKQMQNEEAEKLKKDQEEKEKKKKEEEAQNQTLLKQAHSVYKIHWYKEQPEFESLWKPPTRIDAQMAVSASAGAAFLYGGIGVKPVNEFNSMLQLDIGSHKWQSIQWTGDIPENGKLGHSLSASGNQCILFGGQDNTFSNMKVRECNNDIRILDLKTQRISKIQATNISLEARKNHSASIVGRNLVICGGENSRGNILSDLWYFELGPNRWSEIPTIFLKNNKNIQQQQYQQQYQQNHNFSGSLDVQQQQQQQQLNATTPFAAGISQHRSATILHPERRGQVQLYYNLNMGKQRNSFIETQKNERFKKELKYEGIYFFGGVDRNNQVYDKLYCLQVDVKPMQWVEVMAEGESPQGRYGHSMEYCQMLNILVIYGGKGGGLMDYIQDGIYILRLASMQWVKATAFGQQIAPRTGHCSFVHDTKMFVFGGINDEGFQSNELLQLELDQRLVDKLIEVEEETNNNDRKEFQKKLEFINNTLGLINKNDNNRNLGQNHATDANSIKNSLATRLNFDKFLSFMP